MQQYKLLKKHCDSGQIKVHHEKAANLKYVRSWAHKLITTQANLIVKGLCDTFMYFLLSDTTVPRVVDYRIGYFLK